MLCPINERTIFKIQANVGFTWDIDFSIGKLDWDRAIALDLTFEDLDLIGLIFNLSETKELRWANFCWKDWNLIVINGIGYIWLNFGLIPELFQGIIGCKVEFFLDIVNKDHIVILDSNPGKSVYFSFIILNFLLGSILEINTFTTA
jgi:hypothetical protein